MKNFAPALIEKAKMAKSVEELLALAKENQFELTPEEAAEQKALRDEYIAEFRAQFRTTLENTVVQYPDGSRQTLEEIKNSKKG